MPRTKAAVEAVEPVKKSAAPKPTASKPAAPAVHTNLWDWYWDCLKNYNTFSGRASRSEYWYFVLGNVLVTAALLYLGIRTGAHSFWGALYGLYNIFIFLPAMAVAFRRFHDVNFSGWWVSAPVIVVFLLSFASGFIRAYNRRSGIFDEPSALYFLTGLILIVYPLFIVVIACLKGTKGANRFGPAPK